MADDIDFLSSRIDGGDVFRWRLVLVPVDAGVSVTMVACWRLCRRFLHEAAEEEGTLPAALRVEIIAVMTFQLMR